MTEALRGYWGHSFHLERVRLISDADPPWQKAAFAPPREEHLKSWYEDGRRFDLWLNWDGRASIICEGTTILRFWAPAGEIFRDIERRLQAASARSVAA